MDIVNADKNRLKYIAEMIDKNVSMINDMGCYTWCIKNEKGAHYFLGTAHASKIYNISYMIPLLEKLKDVNFDKVFLEIDQCNTEILEKSKIPNLKEEVISKLKQIKEYQNVTDKKEKLRGNEKNYNNEKFLDMMLDHILAAFFIYNLKEAPLFALEDKKLREDCSKLNEEKGIPNRLPASEAPQTVEEEYKYYQTGKEADFLSLLQRELSTGYDEDDVILRNEEWIKKIIPRLQSELNCLYIIGASHVFPLIIRLLDECKYSLELKVTQLIVDEFNSIIEKNINLYDKKYKNEDL